jgi:hypothetical protein
MLFKNVNPAGLVLAVESPRLNPDVLVVSKNNAIKYV